MLGRNFSLVHSLKNLAFVQFVNYWGVKKTFLPWSTFVIIQLRGIQKWWNWQNGLIHRRSELIWLILKLVEKWGKLSELKDLIVGWELNWEALWFGTMCGGAPWFIFWRNWLRFRRWWLKPDALGLCICSWFCHHEKFGWECISGWYVFSNVFAVGGL